VSPNQVDTLITAPDSSDNYLDVGTGGSKADSMADAGVPAVEDTLLGSRREPLNPASATENFVSVVIDTAKGAGNGLWAGTLSLVSALPFVGRLTGEARAQAFEDAGLKGTWTETISIGAAEVGVGVAATVLSGGTNHVATAVNTLDKIDAGLNVAEGAGRVAQGDEGGAVQLGMAILGAHGGNNAGSAQRRVVPTTR